MSTKNDKYVMFRNFMMNELGITKADIREWIDEAVKEQAKVMVAETFMRKNPEQMIRDAIYEHPSYAGKVFNRDVINNCASILAEKLELKIKEK